MKTPLLSTLAAVILVSALPVIAAAADPALFKAKCAMCHGADGSGQTPVGKTMKMKDLRSEEVQKLTDIELTKLISGGKGKMPAFGQKLTTPEIQSLIAHIRTLK
ncbi:MAG TPA: cytochrome c [Thermoanaerobaculia bacterium]|jgi:cytochrome c6